MARRERPFVEELPEKLRDLMGRTDRIYARLYRLDMMLDPSEDQPDAAPNTVGDQIDQLRAAFADPSRDE